MAKAGLKWEVVRENHTGPCVDDFASSTSISCLDEFHDELPWLDRRDTFGELESTMAL